MRTRMTFLAAGVLLAGCAPDAPLSPHGDAAAEAADAPAPSTNLAYAYTYTNADNDALDDGLEWELANRHAPLLYMPNLISRQEASYVSGDWTWPATVEWYLPQVRMRMHHDNCPDHTVLDFGYVNPVNLVQQSHRRASSWEGCGHTNPTYYSGEDVFSSENHFFLQAGNDDAVHPGQRDPSQWQTYFHAYRNDIGGVSIQYWIFYPYNDYISSANHEGDWEHVNVKLDSAYNLVKVYFSAHNSLSYYGPESLTFWDGTHPRVWVADGSHANFRSQSACNTTFSEGTSQSCWTNDAQRWFTWSGGRGAAAGLQGAGLVNLGEKHAPMVSWLRYSGRWGENGNTSGTSGARGPAHNKHGWWTTDFPASSSGGGGGSTCETSEGGNSPTSIQDNAELQPSC